MKKFLIVILIPMVLTVTLYAGERSELRREKYIVKSKILNSEIVQTSSPITPVYKVDDFLGRKNNSVFIAGLDPRYAMRMEIKHAQGEKLIFKENEEITFVVHSPSMIFPHLPEVKKGEYGEFELVITYYNDKTLGLAIYLYFK
jgi:hypothetical protein